VVDLEAELQGRTCRTSELEEALQEETEWVKTLLGQKAALQDEVESYRVALEADFEGLTAENCNMTEEDRDDEVVEDEDDEERPPLELDPSYPLQFPSRSSPGHAVDTEVDEDKNEEAGHATQLRGHVFRKVGNRVLGSGGAPIIVNPDRRGGIPKDISQKYFEERIELTNSILLGFGATIFCKDLCYVNEDDFLPLNVVNIGLFIQNIRRPDRFSKLNNEKLNFLDRYPAVRLFLLRK